MRETIVIGGALAQRPGRGGHTWVLLQYLLGLRRLSWNVVFIDQLDPDLATDEAGVPCPVEKSVNVGYLAGVLGQFEFGESFCLLHPGGTVGLSRQRLLDAVRNAALLINVNGYITDDEVLGQARTRVFLDIDPGLAQLWKVQGLADTLRGHDRFVTIGENLGSPGCTIPTTGEDWIPTRQPIVLEYWPLANDLGGCFTTVATWRDRSGTLAHSGETFGPRAHSFRRLFDLPVCTGLPFEVALDIDPAEAPDLEALRSAGWRLVPPGIVANNPSSYRAYIRKSRAELMVAKPLYSRTRCGWFSDRSICYLASGKPVVAEDTGTSLPAGDGLILYSDPDEAAAACEEVWRRPSHHRDAARQLATEYFNSDLVLTELLDRVNPPMSATRTG